MNVRKPTDYSAMFAALNELMAANLPHMELYRGIGSVLSGRPEKGTAVAAAEYLQGAYPDAAGFSPRSLRRMRDFCRTYESAPEIMSEAMTISWTQNIVIMEGECGLLIGTGHHTEYSSYLRRRCWRQEAFADILYRPPRQYRRPVVYV